MLSRKIFIIIIMIGLALHFASCPEENNTGGNNTVKPATITFFNSSSYRVDVYKNINPVHYDATALVCTLNPGETKSVEQYSSFDSVTGDAFFMHYHVLLADRLETGTSDILVNAQRVLSNITLVIESGQRYTRTIPQPGLGDLNFYHGYIRVQNQSDAQIQIIRGDNILSKMDNNAIFINAGGIGFYEIEFFTFDTVIAMSQLRAFSSHNVPFPHFTVERGKKYSFIVRGDTVEGPIVVNILP